MCGGWDGPHVHDPLRSDPCNVHDGTVIMNLLQHGPYGLQFDEFAKPSLILHPLQLVVEGEFLVAAIMGQTASELERGGNALEQSRQLLDGG